MTPFMCLHMVYHILMQEGVLQQLEISLFGRLRILFGGQELAGCEALKVQELLSYLLINRDRPHSRELLASMLWGDHCTTEHSKKYLRKALWQLQASIHDCPRLSDSDLLVTEPGWIQLRSIDTLRLDVAIFERAYARVKGVPGKGLDRQCVEALRQAARLYKGDLLEGWFQEWCLTERERFRQIFLIMLDKLMAYYAAHHEYEESLSYGRKILMYDRARERTHRQMMRLYYEAGDRCSALRQYEQCTQMLREELDVAPSHSTHSLHEQIRQDRPLEYSEAKVSRETHSSTVRKMLSSLQTLQADLITFQKSLRGAAAVLEGILGDGGQSMPDSTRHAKDLVSGDNKKNT